MIPLYFNYVDRYPDLLEKAVQSIRHPLIEVRVHRPGIRPFTECLNEILSNVEEPFFFFMHYDATILKQGVFDTMINVYKNMPDAASVAACDLTDLLVLYDTEKIRSIGGWDATNFKNSYMELDLRKRIYRAGYTQPIIYSGTTCPPCIDHADSSKLRKSGDKDNNLYHVYNETFRSDLKSFYEKWTDETMPENMISYLEEPLP